MKKTLQILGFWFLSVSSLQGAGWVFATEEEAKGAFPGEKISTRTIADFSYNGLFLMLLSTDEEYVEYLMSFLNSIYFPDAKENDLKIREIASIDTNLKEIQIYKNPILCDVFCKCTCFSKDDKKGEVQVFYVKIQKIIRTFFLKQFRIKAFDFFNKIQGSVKALCLLKLNKPVKVPVCEKKQETESDTDKQKTIELKTIALHSIDDGDKRTKLGDQAITWLKLFGIRQWNTRDLETKKYRIYYPAKKIDPIIKKAIKLISDIEQGEVNFLELNDATNEDVINTAWELGRREAAKDDALFTSRKEGRRKIILNMSKVGMDPSTIAKCSGLTEEEVNEILSERPSKRARTEEE